MLQLLLDCGCDYEAINVNGQTPLHFANAEIKVGLFYLYYSI